MSHKFAAILCLTLVLGLCGLSFGADFVWTGGSGVDFFWDTPANWNPSGVPQSADFAHSNTTGPEHPVIADGMDVVAAKLYVGKDLAAPFEGESGELTMTGGTLACRFFFCSVKAGDFGVFHMSGGAINQNDTSTPFSFAIGNYGDGTVNMTGGQINVATALRMPGKSRTEGTGGGKAILNLDGGVVRSPELVMYDVADPPELDITEGMLVLDGDDVDTIDGYITNGWITANGGAGTVAVKFVEENGGKTRIVAQNSMASKLAWNASVPDGGSLKLESAAASNGLELTWSAGDGIVSHNVYFGTDYDEVNAATAPDSLEQTAAVYTTGPLEPGVTYYWRVDEVAGAATHKGRVWSFTTSDYVLVDDMEAYGDELTPGEPGGRIWYAWQDGFGWTEPEPAFAGNGTGATVGNWPPPIAETEYVHGGGQALPLSYDNTGASTNALYSETQRVFETPQNWTTGHLRTLTLYVMGDPNNEEGSTDPLYVGLIDSDGGVGIIVHEEPQAVLSANWTQWEIELADFAAAGADLTKVKEMVIGVGTRGNTDAAGGKGTIYIDDIRLNPAQCVVPAPLDVDPASLDVNWLADWLTAIGVDPTSVEQIVIGVGAQDNEIYIDSIQLQQGCVFPPLAEEPSEQ